jgi:hypothetical protein
MGDKPRLAERRHQRERQTTPPLLVAVFVIVWASMTAIGILTLVVK